MPPRIIREQRVVEDHWLHLADDAPLSAEGDVTVSLGRWQNEAESLRAHTGKVGVRVPNTLDIEEITLSITDRPLICLEFPAFGDGRAFTQARLLRERLGYRGELRAVGDVARDQLFYMQRCGFDSYEPRADKDIGEALKAFTEITLTYQGAADTQQTVFARRATR
ncbi:MAG: DUF934 domain-containing protein [Nevskiales bacterium]